MQKTCQLKQSSTIAIDSRPEQLSGDSALPAGDLWKYVSEGLSEEKLRDIATQLLLGLGHLHDKNIVHRDIKPDNFLEFAGEVYKLCDLGFADCAPQKIGEGPVVQGFMGTVNYMAPELVMLWPYSTSVSSPSLQCWLNVVFLLAA